MYADGKFHHIRNSAHEFTEMESHNRSSSQGSVVAVCGRTAALSDPSHVG